MKIKILIIIASLLFLPMTVSAQGEIQVPQTETSKPKKSKKKKKKKRDKTPQNSSQNNNGSQSRAVAERKVLSYDSSTGELKYGSYSYKIVYVRGGSFNMGATPEQINPESSEGPIHKVTLTDYFIGQTEVPQWLWTAVMGSNPSHFKGETLPVEQVSWNDCQTFIKKLNTLIPLEFTLPTEAQWEYAARGGLKSRTYQYSGSNTLSDVGWYSRDSDNRTHNVATKNANEAGVYDMSGNVCEWCADWWGYYSAYRITNPRGAKSGEKRVYRGGDFSWADSWCRVSFRGGEFPDRGGKNIGFRIAINAPATKQVTYNYTTGDLVYGEHRYKMVLVDGGTFKMGATKEQKRADSIEKPVHQVTLSSFYIGETEVPQWLWVAVMGYNPSKWEGDYLPVERVSRTECQEFLQRLTDLTGKRFSLPTEAQWEYAARGGKHSHGYQYSGGKKPDNVAWYKKNSGGRNHEVTDRKAPNELGLYDMSGNVAEMCNDRLGPYPEGNVTDPMGASTGNYYVKRGGTWDDKPEFLRVAMRGGIKPDDRADNVGFRLAL